MAVYTKIGQSEIISITKKFKLDKIIKFQGIKNGIENTNYLLKTKKNKYILTIFEKRVKKKDLPFFMKLMDKLNSYNISCPKPLKNKNGKYLTLIKKKTACIVTFVNGQDKKTLNIQNCYKIGKNIAKLHRTSKKIKLFRKNSMSINSLDPLLKSIKFKSKNISPNLQSVLTQSLNKIKKDWPKKLPKGIIHGDLFIDNIFLKKTNLLDLLTSIFLVQIILCMS